MLACVDVDYRDHEALAACVLFDRWTAEQPAAELTQRVSPVAPYEPGQFYRRELPCLLAVLGPITTPLRAIVIDGYVWLGDERRPGLGAHLYESLLRQIPVIGVAKTHFHGARLARPVVRGDSQKPLWITAAGLELDDACRYVQGMHGPYRIPTLLRRVDQLCRQTAMSPPLGPSS